MTRWIILSKGKNARCGIAWHTKNDSKIYDLLMQIQATAKEAMLEMIPRRVYTASLALLVHKLKGTKSADIQIRGIAVSFGRFLFNSDFVLQPRYAYVKTNQLFLTVDTRRKYETIFDTEEQTARTFARTRSIEVGIEQVPIDLD